MIDRSRERLRMEPPTVWRAEFVARDDARGKRILRELAQHPTTARQPADVCTHLAIRRRNLESSADVWQLGASYA